MALTPGFKKFVGLVGAIAVFGGGYFYWKQMPHPAPVQETQQIVEAPVQQAQQPLQQAPQQAEVQEAPVQVAAPHPAPSRDASSNRGMSAVLEAGKK